MGITKRGDPYAPLIHGPPTVLRHAEGKTDRLSRWALAVQARRGANVATVALANRFGRIDNSITCRLVRYKGHPRPDPT